MKHVIIILIFLIYNFTAMGQTIRFYDAETNEPVSFATVSFGDGLGAFANADGEFLFQKKRYPDVDTLFVSALGYADLKLVTTELEPAYAMQQEIDQLKEVVITTARKGKFKTRETKPVSHNDYHNSWLQTVESEIAVLFRKQEAKPTQLATLRLPINVKEAVSGKNISVRKFSTLMRVKFYENENGKPGSEISYGNIVFVITEKEEKEIFELDISANNIFIPENGMFVSIQVLGPTDASGNLIQTKTYNEYKTRRGLEKIAVSFRPLLPLTNQIRGQQTFVRRIFFNNKKWQVFDFNYNPNSVLLRKGYNNYGMGAELRVYED
tara:strand:- start:22956 stop:23927 length:972 start_codon:yes stop_codon:yes gene_type:complete